MQLITSTGQAHRLKIGTNTIGRGADCDVVLQDRSMSRLHAELHWDGEHCRLTDLGSTNGTFLAGRRLAPHQPQPVSPGVPMSFGPTMMVTLTTDAGIAATAAVPFQASPPVPATGLHLLSRAIDVAMEQRKLALSALGILAAGILGASVFRVFVGTLWDSALLSAAVGLVGAILLWCILTFVAAILSRLIVQELGRGKRESIRQAFRYVRRHYLAFLLSPLVLVIGLILVVVGESVFLLLGRIQYIGELAVSLAFLPLIVLNLTLILVAWFGSALIYPIVADVGCGIAETIASVLALFRRAPGRLVAYMLLTGMTSLLGFVFSSYLILAAVSSTAALASMGMEADKFMSIANWLSPDLGELIPGLTFGSLTAYGLPEPPITIIIARFLFGLSMLLLVALILAIPQTLYLGGVCAVYLSLGESLTNPGGENRPLNWLASRLGKGHAEEQRTCWLCGAVLVPDQTYCLSCKQMQQPDG
jgi:hypothetical protein